MDIHECELMKEENCSIMFEPLVSKYHIQRNTFNQDGEKIDYDILFNIKYCPFCGEKL